MTAHFRDVIRNYFKLPGCIITQSALPLIRTFFQSDISVECYLVLSF